MISYNDFLTATDPQNIPEFKHSYDVFKKDNRARTSLNKTLETSYKAVYRRESKYKSPQWSADDINLSGEDFYIVTANGKILSHTNSEWGAIEVAKKW
jgi:hypothetical protein